MKIYIAGHADYAESVFNILKFFKENLEDVDFMIFDNTYEERLEKFIRDNEGDELIVVTDLLGGSVNACAMNLLKKYRFKLFSGVNIAFLLELIFSNDTSEEHLRMILEESRKENVFVNDLLNRKEND